MSELPNKERIALLAATIEDYLPGPWMGRREWSAEGPSERRQCRACEGEGRRRTRRGMEPCQACGSKGSVLVDAYTGKVVGKIQSADAFALRDGEIAETLAAERADVEARLARRRRVDKFLDDLAGQREGEDWVDFVLRRKRTYYRLGDYEKLIREAGTLSHFAEVAFWKVYGPDGTERSSGPRLTVAARWALGELDVLMPNCRVPGWLLVPRSRDDEIVALNAKGLAQAAIAQRIGVSQQTVSRVLRAEVA